MTKPSETIEPGENDIAIVGMAAHLPGAGTLQQYWQNLRDGVRSIRPLTEEELRAENPALRQHKNYVPATSALEGFEKFDSEFFGFSPQEAAIMDPQHRQFLEVAWEALETAGHVPEAFDGTIGVYAGCGMGSYFYFNLCTNPDLVRKVGLFLLRHTGNDKDFLATRVSHIFNLKGPSVNIQTACSTSLVTTHYACQGLLRGECDLALAGGVTIELPHRRGYIYHEGEVLSPDGECHAFDHRAQGTVFGSGAGVVALRRLADAIAEGDHIWAVIKGTAINNDGAAKAGYLAPSIDGQAAAVVQAHAVAGLKADTIDYIECHGTGTYLGDPIEIAALTQAFQETTDETGFCRVGSVKTNIGHLDTAAGVASLIKASLAAHHRQIPPSLGYEAPNPAIDFEASPFKVADQLMDWISHKGPRRAGVNSLGVGGTNAHVLIEEAPERAPSDAPDWPYQLLTISGRNQAALDANTAALAAHLRDRPEQPLADIAWTLKEGRRAFEKRRIVVAETHEAAASLLEKNDPRRVFTHTKVGDTPETVFLFPGGGTQYPNMARDLYETEPVFADWMDRGLDILNAKLDYDIRALWLPESGQEVEATEQLQRPLAQLPLIMIVEHALAQLWMSWGIAPAVLVGHSLGENAAACLSGVMSFEDCIGLTHLRGVLLDSLPPGAMVSVSLAAEELEPLMGDQLDMASINAPDLSVASGPIAEIEALEGKLASLQVEFQRIRVNVAAHSRMLDPVLPDFRAYLRSIRLSRPKIPLLSNVTGAFITDAQATDPDYWVQHLRSTVRFADCITTLSVEPDRIYLEVGPGKALSALTQSHGGVPAQHIIATLRHPKEEISDDAHFLSVIGRLWAVGVDLDWGQIWGAARRNRVPLPTYAFQRSSYFIEPGASQIAAAPDPLRRLDDIAKWGWRPVWTPKLAACEIDVETGLSEAERHTWLIFVDDTGLGDRIVDRLRAAGHRVVTVHPGDAFTKTAQDTYVLSPEQGRDGYDALLRDLVAQDTAPDRIAHFWLVTGDESFRPGSSFFHRNQDYGFYSLMFLAQAISDEGLPGPIHISAVTSGTVQVGKEAAPYPEKSTVMGPVRVIPRELPGVSCSMLDIVPPEIENTLFGRRQPPIEQMDWLASRVLEDLLAPAVDTIAAQRGEKRFERVFRTLELAPDAQTLPWTTDTAWMLIGGLGGIGLAIAEELVRTGVRNLVMVARQEMPPRSRWAAHLHGYGPMDTISRRIRAVERLEAQGARVMVAAADVSNLKEMQSVCAQAREAFGEIRGVVHAAGIVDDGPLLAKTTASVETMFAPKIHGTQTLHHLFPDGTLEWLVLFSSTSTITAPAGQIDYVAANEYLNAYAHSRAGGKTRVVALNWGIWNEVGMAAEQGAARMGALPEIPVTDVDVPLLDKATFDKAGHRIFTARYGNETHWMLDGHRVKAGDALMPGTGYLEIAAQALAAQGETGPFEVRDLLFLRPLKVADGTPRDVRVQLARSDEGYALTVQSGLIVDGRPAFETNAQARLQLGRLMVPDPLDIAAIKARCDVKYVPDDPAGIHLLQEAYLTLGPRWRVTGTLAYGRGEGIARLVLPEAFQADLDQGYLLHPALLHLATGWAMELIEGYTASTLWMSVSYDTVRAYAPLPAEIVSWVRGGAASEAEFARFDIVLADRDGRVCVEIFGFSLRKLENAASLTHIAAPKAGEVEFAEGVEEVQPLSPAEERFAHNLAQGILPADGAEAFRRALAIGLPQLVVSSLDLEALTAQTTATDTVQDEDGQMFARPELDNAYIAPSTDIERTLAGFWEELLGVAQVGVADSFFDLGGHSLIAVRLFARIKKAYRVDFPISVLFEAPTISTCAALIADRIGGDDSGEGDDNGEGGEGGDEADAAAPAEPARRFTHLVPIHQGVDGPRLPIFLVAGMYGNVLNLRHLALLIGSDRPVYGLQARGLYGADAPHTSLVAAAGDCIAELRQVQPHGPYLLGGFSGGGITAFEMAKQLTQAGEEIVLLAMLDTPLPHRPRPTRQDKALITLQLFKERGALFVSEWAHSQIQRGLGKLHRRFEEPEAVAGHMFHNAAVATAFHEAMASYQMHIWPGPAVLFRPPLDRRFKATGGNWISSDREYVFEDNQWASYLPNLRVIEVPGDHDSMVLEPNVRVLGRCLKDCILEAESSLTRTYPPLPAE